MAGWRTRATAICLALALCAAALAAAEDAAPPVAPPGGAAALATQERQVLERFSELEKKLLRMAELTAGTDPHRASLLRKAVAQSKQQGIEGQLAQLVELLGQDRLAPAVKSETAVGQDLAHLLELLLSEDRSKRLQSEKERIGRYIQRVNQLIKQQKQLQGETSGEGDPKQLAERQRQLAEKAGELAQDLAAEQDDSQKGKKSADAKTPDGEGKQPGAEGAEKDKPDGNPYKKPDDGKEKKPSDGKPGESKPSDGKPSDGKPGDGKSGDEKSPDGKPEDGKPDDKKPGDGKPEEMKPGEGKPGGDSQPGDGQPQGTDKPPKPGEEQPGGGSPGKPGEKSGDAKPEGEQKPEDQQAEKGNPNPARQRIAAAEEKMHEAEKRLAEAQRDKAVEKQEEAKRELELAKAELEAILRQLREEEIGRTLAMLESRFRKMLEMQNQANTGTKRLDKVPAAERDHDDEIEAGRLSRQEAQIVVEANKALALLHDEGSAVAFPEAVSDLRDDMEQVVVRLAQNKVDTMTQSLEDDIVVALEEMIAAFHKAQKQIEGKAGGQAGGDGESPLVDTLAELKMIKSMQMWVNGRTKRFSELTKTDQAETPDLIAALRRLSEREERIRRVTRDIVVGRNQ